MAQNRSACSVSLALRNCPSAVTMSTDEEIVDGQAVLAHQPAHAAVERQAADAGGGDQPDRDGQAEGLRRTIDVAQRRAALHLHGPSDRVHPNGPHRRQVDDEPIVADRLAGDIVAAAADGQKAPRARRAKFTAAITSAALVHRAISAGCLSISPFQTLRTSS